MQLVGYSIKLWHRERNKYEDLNFHVMAESRKAAIAKFRNETKWIDKKGTLLVASPPICR